MGLPGAIIYIGTDVRLGPDRVTDAAGGNFAVSTARSKTEWDNEGRRVTVGITPDGPRYNPITPSVGTFHLFAPQTVTVYTLSIAAVTLSADVPVTVVGPTDSMQFDPAPGGSVVDDMPPVRGVDSRPVEAPTQDPVADVVVAVAVGVSSVELVVGPLLTSLTVSFSEWELYGSDPANVDKDDSLDLTFAFSPIYAASHYKSMRAPVPVTHFPFAYVVLRKKSE